MKLRRVTMRNFGPYYGEHELTLEVTTDSPVVLVFGENMRGKTSIKNALLWCLYQHTTDRRGNPKQAIDHLSYDAIDSGEFYMTVSLDFEHDAHSYRLERHAQADSKPASDDDLEFKLSLQKDGHFIATGAIQEEIANILHENISRFFFFDADMLQQYEILLSEPGRDAELVKGSIEQILGLPAIQLVTEDLDQAARDAQQRQLRAVQAERRNEALVADVQQKEEEASALERDLEGLERSLAELEAERVDLRDRLEQFAAIQADLRELDGHEARVSEIDREEREQRDIVRSVLRDAWWIPMAATVDRRLGEISEAVRAATELQERWQALQTEREHLEHSLTDRACALCGQSIADATKDNVARRLEEVAQELGTLGSGSEGLGGLLAEQGRLQDFSRDLPPARLTEAERAVRRLGIEKRRLDRRIMEIRDRLGRHERSEIQAIERQLEECLRQLRDVMEDIDGRRASKERIDRELRELRQRLQNLPGADPRTATETEVFAGLRQIFDGAVSRYRDKMREEVEREASDIFRQLTTEPEYAGLQINEQFGLQILDNEGRVIAERSAGAEQIVAMSLIGALNRCATREGPIVVDTPFARLDRRHRKNVLEFLPSMGPQAVLLIQSGELDADRDLVHLEGKIGREFDLVRDSPTRSHFEQRGH